MLTRLAIVNYRSLTDLRIELGQLNLITGANGSGKSNLYRALRLLHETAEGGVARSIAREGGLRSTLWAGPESLSQRMRGGEVPVQGTLRKKRVRLKLGFLTGEFGYSISLGLPTPSSSAFALDPEIKYEAIWAGGVCRPASVLVERNGPIVSARLGRDTTIVRDDLQLFDSMLSEVIDVSRLPEVLSIRDEVSSWRFYDHFRTDSEAPARLPALGTRTSVLSHEGHDLAAALQTIIEIGDSDALRRAVDRAFPGASVRVTMPSEGRFAVEFRQPGLLRPLSGGELSDGTLRYLLWIAALLTPRPPAMMVLNEPETSLHPSLLPALADLISEAAAKCQVWVISHADPLIKRLRAKKNCMHIPLEKKMGETRVAGEENFEQPSWRWGDGKR